MVYVYCSQICMNVIRMPRYKQHGRAILSYSCCSMYSLLLLLHQFHTIIETNVHVCMRALIIVDQCKFIFKLYAYM